MSRELPNPSPPQRGTPSLAGTVLVLFTTSLVVDALVLLRIAVTGRWGYALLGWNLFLAWVPLLLALAAGHCHRKQADWNWRLLGWSMLWLLFFPNAPYIFTDLVHLNDWARGHYWIDLVMVLMAAMTGFLLGFVSLCLMHSIVSARLGWKSGWAFVICVAGLSGMGIYLGRFLRWNSWDALLHPVGVSRDIARLAAHPLANAHHLEFQAAFGLFLLLGYLSLYALTWVGPGRTAPVSVGRQPASVSATL